MNSDERDFVESIIMMAMNDSTILKSVKGAVMKAYVEYRSNKMKEIADDFKHLKKHIISEIEKRRMPVSEERSVRDYMPHHGYPLGDPRAMEIERRRGKRASSELRKKVIRLAHQNPELRKDLLPLLKESKSKPSKEEIEEIKNTKWQDWKPVPLPDDLYKYFKKTNGAIKVPIGEITPIRAREKGISNANRYMWLTYLGEMQPRKPISLKKNEDGSYTVLDGNSTFANAKANKWKYLYGLVEK